ncbi:MAG: hypothetical protein IPF41_04555 [Flavobacteriales bacterium]|nr:hypothetical protein [Flavobacteriales bacterium]
MKTVLKLEGTDYPVLQMSYSMQRQTDHNGRPAEDVRGGSIHLSLESTDNTKFAQWMTSPFTRKSGSIEWTDNKGNLVKSVNSPTPIAWAIPRASMPPTPSR